MRVRDLTLPLTLAALTGCAGGIGSRGGVITDPDDQDGDGYTFEEDCDDEDPEVNPGADEICNDKDDDCDGAIDLFDDSVTGTVSGYADNDGDGFGDPEEEVVGCELGAGLVEDNTDCDDSIATVNPDSEEDCNTGADDDCDGETNDLDADNCIVFYRDADGDGYGGPESACTCQPTTDYSEYFEEDCNDDDSAINPGAAEVCGDGIDNNCADDPEVCELRGNLPLGDNADAAIFGLAEDDLLGTAVAIGGDLTADGLDDIVVAAPGYGDAGGAVGVFEGVFSGEAGLDDADALLLGTAGEALTRLASGADLTGDGQVDLAVGGSTAGGGDGAVWVWPGPTVGLVNSSDLTRISGGTGDQLGLVGVAGDLTGDGTAELLVGSQNSGDVYVHTGPHTASVSADAGSPLGGAGFSLSALAPLGDVDGDGVDDFGVGAAERSTNGRFWLFTSWSSSLSSVNDADAEIDGKTADDRFGHAASGAGDVNGDGYADFAVGAPGVDQDSRDEGAVFLFLGAVTSGVASDLASTTFQGELSADEAGSSVSGGGDINGDGNPDLVIGSYGHDEAGTNSGMTYVLYGPWTATQELRRADAFLVGRSRRDESGTSVSMAGDLDGDGFHDVITGGPENDEVAQEAGVVDILFGDGI